MSASSQYIFGWAVEQSKASVNRAKSFGAECLCSTAKLNVDIGRGRALKLPDSEVERRWSITTPQWPLMNAVLYAVSRDHFMARHKSNHIQVAYAPDGETARSVLASKAAAVAELGITVNFCGECGFSMS